MTLTQQSPTKSWHLDKVHSSATFQVRHSGVSIFHGSFGEFDGRLRFADDQPELTGSVKVASVQVPDETLTGHLLAPDFFDAERYPEIRFTSTSVQRAGDDAITVEGDLEIKGTTRRVTAHGSLSHVEADLVGSERYGVALETTIDRNAFGVDWTAELPNGGQVLGSDVKLIVHLEFTPEA